ncbi:MAG: DUF6089 family protein [Bacteroidota bacterium]
MKRTILLLVLMTLFKVSYSQRYEIGVFAGGNNVIGDIGSDYYVNPNGITGGGLFKWNVNPRLALRANIFYSISTGNYIDSNYPYDSYSDEFAGDGERFENHIGNGEILAEWNFLEYDLRTAKNHTPYMFLGIGGLIFDGSSSGRTIQIPFGVGYKYALSYKWVLGADLGFRYTFTNNLDASEIKSVGNLNSNDWFTTLGLTLTYVFGRDPCCLGQ